MKTRWYRKSGVKGLLVLLTIVFVTVACTGAGASVLIMSKGVQPLDSKNYVDSQSFQDNMYSLSPRSPVSLLSGSIFPSRTAFHIRSLMRSMREKSWIRQTTENWLTLRS